MYINNYFNTTIWSEQKPEFIKSLNKASNKYISDARKREKEYIKKNGDFGRSYPSTPPTADNDFLNFRTNQVDEGWGYAVFGKVVEGLDVVDQIAATQTTSVPPYQDVPVEPIKILKAERVD